MATSPLVLPGLLYVGEDDRARLLAFTGPAAGWMVPQGILGWSHEVSIVAREALTPEICRSLKIVTPAEQIPAAKYPLTLQAAQKSPLIAVSSRLTSKLADAGVRVHTVGVDRISSSFYYLAEGGGEDPITAQGDLVAAVGAMLGERADNAAIERVMDGLVDRLMRSLSKDRVTELALELAAALPRAAADGSGLSGVELDAFEKQLGELVASSEKYRTFAQEICDALTGTTERRLDVQMYGEAKKVSQGPFDLAIGDHTVSLPTYERWVMTGPRVEPTPKAKPAVAEAPKVEAPKVEAPKVEAPKVEAPKVEAPKVEAPKVEAPKAEAPKVEPKKAEEKKVEAPKVEEKKAEAPKVEAAPKKVEEKKAEAPKVEEKKAEAPKVEEKKAEAAPKVEEKKAEAPKKVEEKKAEAPKVQEKKAEEKLAKVERAKSERPKAASEPPSPAIERKKDEPAKGGGTTWIVLALVAAVVAVVAWKLLGH